VGLGAFNANIITWNKAAGKKGEGGGENAKTLQGQLKKQWINKRHHGGPLGKEIRVSEMRCDEVNKGGRRERTQGNEGFRIGETRLDVGKGLGGHKVTEVEHSSLGGGGSLHKLRDSIW